MIIPVVTEDMIYFSKLKSLTNENYELLHVKRSEDMDKLNLAIINSLSSLRGGWVQKSRVNIRAHLSSTPQ